MTEWWTYSLRDLLLCSPRTYYRLFELYNLELWPLPLFAAALGVTVLLLWWRRSGMTGRALAFILTLCWLWVAWAYHWQRYANINWAANYYALAFAFEALLLLWHGVVCDRLKFAAVTRIQQRIGLVLLVFSLLCFPLLGPLLGRNFTQAEVFGMAPDPTALATLGIRLIGGVQLNMAAYADSLSMVLAQRRNTVGDGGTGLYDRHIRYITRSCQQPWTSAH